MQNYLLYYPTTLQTSLFSTTLQTSLNEHLFVKVFGCLLLKPFLDLFCSSIQAILAILLKPF